MLWMLLACAEPEGGGFFPGDLPGGGGGGGGDDDTGVTEPRGDVRLDDGVLVDGTGPIRPLGATMMWAAWGYRHDRDRLERNLATLADAGFDYVRALGVVGDTAGADYWDGREISAAWEDYDAVIAGLTDLAWEGYGLRVEWTLIGDGQVTVPTEAERYALADRFLTMVEGREDRVVLLEVANEAWQNGFDGDAGNEQLRALSRYLRERTTLPVAASAPVGVSCEDWRYVYDGDVADVATLHFDRDTSTREGGWRPVRLPWTVDDCDGLPLAANNEPIGPGSSVATEEDPTRITSAAAVSWVAGLPYHVFHSGAGVRGDEDFAAMAGVGDFGTVQATIPAEVATWTRADHRAGPFVAWARDAGGTEHADTLWTELGDPATGASGVYSRVDGDRFVTVAIGILGELRLEAREAMEVRAVHPVGGRELASASLAAGQSLTLTGTEAAILTGTLSR